MSRRPSDSAVTNMGTLNGTDSIPIDRAGVDAAKKTTPANILTYVEANATAFAATAHTHTQAQSHSSPDTDVATSSLHHTIGTGATQAAAGNHNHTTPAAISVSFAPAGSIAATNVQTAIEELDTEKAALANYIDWANPIAITTTPTTLTIGKNHVITETTANRNHTLPAASGNAGKLLSVFIAQTTDKLISIVSGDTTAKTGTITGGTGSLAAGTGTVSCSASATLTGSGTAFTTQLKVGDLIHVGVTTRRVIAIASNTALTMDVAATIGSSAFTYTSTGIVGSGTNFDPEITVGDIIVAGGESKEVVWRNSDTELAVDRPWTSAPAGVAFAVANPIINGKGHRVMWAGESAILECDGTNWVKVGGSSRPMIAGLYPNAATVAVAATDTKVSINTELLTPSVASMHNATNNYMLVPRNSNYILECIICTYNNNASATRFGPKIFIDRSAALGMAFDSYSLANTYTQTGTTTIKPLTSGQHIELYGIFTTGSYTGNNAFVGAAVNTYLKLIEVPQW